MQQPFANTEITFEEELSVERLHLFLLDTAKESLQQGFLVPTLYTVYGLRAEAYQLPPSLTPQERQHQLTALKEYVVLSRPRRAAYICEGHYCTLPVTDPRYAAIAAGTLDIRTVPGYTQMINMTIQDPARYWQYVHNIITLEDGTRYPGELLMGQDPYLPSAGIFNVPALFYGPPPNTPKIGLN